MPVNALRLHRYTTNSHTQRRRPWPAPAPAVPPQWRERLKAQFKRLLADAAFQREISRAIADLVDGRKQA
jgi:hypothetical protein